ncbi:MAG: DUF3039 domain-containing protein [Actinomycetota bacterium]|nr:DUF3039 domain-containing protein [Actinomycetota bacterium]
MSSSMYPLAPVLSGDTITDERTDERVAPVTTDGGDHERFAHYVKKTAILPSAIEGTPLEALCGKKWVPTRDPQKFPVCPECKEIYESLKGD